MIANLVPAGEHGEQVQTSKGASTSSTALFCHLLSLRSQASGLSAGTIETDSPPYCRRVQKPEDVLGPC